MCPIITCEEVGRAGWQDPPHLPLHELGLFKPSRDNITSVDES